MLMISKLVMGALQDHPHPDADIHISMQRLTAFAVIKIIASAIVFR